MLDRNKITTRWPPEKGQDLVKVASQEGLDWGEVPTSWNGKIAVSRCAGFHQVAQPIEPKTGPLNSAENGTIEQCRKRDH